MAGEPRTPGRSSRPISGTSSDPSRLPTPDSDASTAPITANTPLPPLTPLPLASQSGGGSAAPQPPEGLWTPPADQPALPPLPTNAYPPPGTGVEAAPQPPRGASGAAISPTWAAYSLFILTFTSLILIVAMGIAAAVISKKADVLGWIIALAFVINLVYAFVVFRIANPGQPIRLPFMSPRRGP